MKRKKVLVIIIKFLKYLKFNSIILLFFKKSLSFILLFLKKKEIQNEEIENMSEVKKIKSFSLKQKNVEEDEEACFDSKPLSLKFMKTNTICKSFKNKAQNRLKRMVHVKSDENLSNSENIVKNESFIGDDEMEKRRVSRGRVIDELIQTEVDFYKVMKLLYDVYLGPLSESTVRLFYSN